MKHRPMVRISCDQCSEVSINLPDDPDLDGQLYRLGWEEVGPEHYCPRCKKERELGARIYDLENVIACPKYWLDRGYWLIMTKFGDGYRATIEQAGLNALVTGIGDTPESALFELQTSMEKYA